MRHAEDIAEIVTAAHTLTRLAAQQTRNDAPATQWRALSVLKTDGAMRLGELAVATRTTQPGMTRLTGQLVEAGLVHRRHDPTDSRATVLSITDAGVAALAVWRRELRDALAPLFDDLDDDDWAALARVARILTSRTLPSRTISQGAAR